MSRVPRPVSLLACAAVLLAIAPATAAAEPAPFGRTCTPQDGVRVCPAATLDQRVPSFDGTPIDVDVTLPPEGDGPFPLLLLLHALGGTKNSFANPSTGNPGYDARSFARRGYAVMHPTQRGYGNSCGRPESRTAGCEGGWSRLGDMRYEVRDVQTLAGLLVDQGIARPDAIGTTGVSYGGGMSTMLAFLKDRIRTLDGGYAPWASPNGVPLRIAAAWPRWQWSNGEGIFSRNGRGPWSRTPIGVPTKAYADVIFVVGMSGFVMPTGGDITADLVKWKANLDRGTLGPEVQPILDLSYDLHGVAGMPGTPAPLLLQSGWTDALFPAGQAFGAYDAIRAKDPNAPVALQLGDLGHDPGANHPGDTAAFNQQGIAFLDSWLKATGTKLAPGLVTAFTTVCPKEAQNGGGPFTASRRSELAPGSLSFGTKRRLRIDSRGKDKDLAAALSPIAATVQCASHEPDRTNRATFQTRSPGVTLLGPPVLTGRVRTTGDLGQLIARLWDLDPKSGTQRLITRGAYRLTDDQRGRFRFALDGNGWRFVKGHRIVVELLGRDAPTYGPSATTWRASLTKLRFALPVRERLRVRR